ncbi:arabinose efflux permease family protein [Burkholderia sp. Ch1-1]|uniref:MFS transporter n=1 Tax=Paraburkholderia sp. USG1 TaxID=2952268 RepID=UPI0001D23D10|nr:MFS transporter [Paraburkholderia sp. USG1]EIF34497.1 arabinose efflux permease family protein [Burkholderia sp. Ch1-1]MDR8395361.1 MFS transporter [Paraburkholderia sp. USG1]
MWMTELDKTERRTMAGCFLGWTLDALDVQVYSFVIPTLLVGWRISATEAGMLGTVTLLASAVGGWLSGIAADRYGRVAVLQATILWYALFTFASGFTQNYEQLFICRALQGFGFGGEWAAGAVLIGETVRDAYRGRAVGVVQSGWAVGWGLAALLFGLFFSIMPEHLAWRALFWIGLAPALLVFWVRRHVPESSVFRKVRRERHAAGVMRQLGGIFHADYLATTLKVSALAMGSIGGSYTFLIWLPTYLKRARGLSVIGTTGYTTVMILGAFVGFILGAYLADAIGRKKTFAVSAFGSAALLGIYMLVPISNQAMLILGFPLGLCAFMMFSPMGPYMTELFPTRIRGAGQGFCYNFGRGVGALFPAMVGKLTAVMGLGNAIATFGIAAYALMLLAVLLLPETLGRPLPEEETERSTLPDGTAASGYTPS